MSENNEIHPKLKSFYKDISEKEKSFLEKLSIEEQGLLASQINTFIDEEAGALFPVMAFVSKMLPAGFRAKIAQDMLGPKAVAKMTSMLPVPMAISTAVKMKPDFLAETSLHLQPEMVSQIVEGSPDHLLISITKILIKNGQFETLGGFSDHLSVRKLKVLAERLKDNVEGMVQIAWRMENQQRMIDTAIKLDDTFLLSLMKGISKFEYYTLAAKVGMQLDINRQISMLKKLDTAEAARLAAHYNPEIIAKLSEKIETKTMVDIALQLSGEVLGNCFNYFSTNVLNEVLPYIHSDKLKESMPYINLKKFEDIVPHLNDKAKEAIIIVAKDYSNEVMSLLSK